MKKISIGPLYLQVRSHMKSRIESGEWPEGSVIPGENELAEFYKVSRVTMRTAIKALVDDGTLVRKAGFGTTVAMNRSSMSNFTLVRSFTNEMNEMGLPSKTMQVELRMIEADVILASIFGIQPGDKLYNLRRVRGTVVPIQYCDTYLLPVVEIPNDKEILTGSLYAFLTKQNVFFSHFEEVVTAVRAPKPIRQALLIYDEYTPQLKRKRFSYDDRNKLIEYTETFYHTEHYEYRTEIFYRK
ncbi:GntR family transcriptional regulator [Acholeplasma hippikon]|uniref:Uncharacterized HTH-type transcriptional regulator yegW n=1 Tax=Acholeplasma hippikon TaxID=264636 RepID=A0A449BLK0_9MOLU|nr:GntR family transcriptional regulator [Acholeplasma hippikon]VEU83311.1 Uncharacterized HTH-type transcriptional regulator yegW [Acholeplasma hippikon]